MRFPALIALSLLLSACPPPEEKPPPIPGEMTPTGEAIAEVNGSKITNDMFESLLRRLPPERQEVYRRDAAQREQVVERLVMNELLYREALSRKVYEDPTVQLAVAMSIREVLAGEAMSQIGDEAVTDEAVEKKYKSMDKKYKQPSNHLYHILVMEKNLADELRARIDKGEDFLALAKQHSKDRGLIKHGGDLGWQERPPVKELIEPIAAAQKGEVVGPIETRRGYSIVKVVDKRSETPLEEVRAQVEQMLKMEAMREFGKDLREEADVKITGQDDGGATATDDEVTPPPDPAASGGGH